MISRGRFPGFGKERGCTQKNSCRLLSYTRKLDSEEYSGRVEYIRTIRMVPVVHGTVRLDTHMIEVLIRTYVHTCVTYGTRIRTVRDGDVCTVHAYGALVPFL